MPFHAASPHKTVMLTKFPVNLSCRRTGTRTNLVPVHGQLEPLPEHRRPQAAVACRFPQRRFPTQFLKSDESRRRLGDAVGMAGRTGHSESSGVPPCGNARSGKPGRKRHEQRWLDSLHVDALPNPKTGAASFHGDRQVGSERREAGLTLRICRQRIGEKSETGAGKRTCGSLAPIRSRWVATARRNTVVACVKRVQPLGSQVFRKPWRRPQEIPATGRIGSYGARLQACHKTALAGDLGLGYGSIKTSLYARTYVEAG